MSAPKVKHSKRHTGGRILHTHLKCMHVPPGDARDAWGSNDTKPPSKWGSCYTKTPPNSASSFDKRVAKLIGSPKKKSSVSGTQALVPAGKSTSLNDVEKIFKECPVCMSHKCSLCDDVIISRQKSESACGWRCQHSDCCTSALRDEPLPLLSSPHRHGMHGSYSYGCSVCRSARIAQACSMCRKSCDVIDRARSAKITRCNCLNRRCGNFSCSSDPRNCCQQCSPCRLCRLCGSPFISPSQRLICDPHVCCKLYPYDRCMACDPTGCELCDHSLDTNALRHPRPEISSLSPERRKSRKLYRSAVRSQATGSLSLGSSGTSRSASPPLRPSRKSSLALINNI